MKLKLKPLRKRPVAITKKRIRAEDSAPVEPIIIKSHLRRLERK